MIFVISYSSPSLHPVNRFFGVVFPLTSVVRSFHWKSDFFLDFWSYRGLFLRCFPIGSPSGRDTRPDAASPLTGGVTSRRPLAVWSARGPPTMLSSPRPFCSRSADGASVLSGGGDLWDSGLLPSDPKRLHISRPRAFLRLLQRGWFAARRQGGFLIDRLCRGDKLRHAAAFEWKIICLANLFLSARLHVSLSRCVTLPLLTRVPGDYFCSAESQAKDPVAEAPICTSLLPQKARA